MQQHHIIKPRHYAQCTQTTFDVCNVQYTIFLCKCIKLLHVILPGARQLKKLGLGWRIQKTTTTEKRGVKNWKEAQGRWIQYKTSQCASVCSFVHSWVTHTLLLPD